MGALGKFCKIVSHPEARGGKKLCHESLKASATAVKRYEKLHCFWHETIIALERRERERVDEAFLYEMMHIALYKIHFSWLGRSEMCPNSHTTYPKKSLFFEAFCRVFFFVCPPELSLHWSESERRQSGREREKKALKCNSMWQKRIEALNLCERWSIAFALHSALRPFRRCELNVESFSLYYFFLCCEFCTQNFRTKISCDGGVKRKCMATSTPILPAKNSLAYALSP